MHRIMDATDLSIKFRFAKPYNVDERSKIVVKCTIRCHREKNGMDCWFFYLSIWPVNTL